ncbi:MAG: ATP-binding cassette domain-containing protein [Clostridia bacterium]|nr:ATP-binding cassette domain-containing protein [Clostridia bacterium]
MIEVKNLVKKYGPNMAVKDISFTINDGEIVGFLGPNGAGKSTTMNIITGYLSATSGSVEINGYDILEQPDQAKRHIGYLPEHPPLFLDMTVKEYLNFVYDLKKTKLPRGPHLAEIAKLVKIEQVYNRLIRNLSKGYKQRVGIAQALVGNPDVLILDEPTVGLDPQQIIEIRNLISQLGRSHTVILSSHILSEIQAVCERIIIINQGYQIADDTAAGLSEKLSDDHSIIVRIIAPPREAKTMLESVPGVLSVQVTGIHGNATEFKVDPQGVEEATREIAERAMNKHWPIIGLHTNELTLEDIYIRMVNENPELLNIHAKVNEEAVSQQDVKEEPQE